MINNFKAGDLLENKKLSKYAILISIEKIGIFTDWGIVLCENKKTWIPFDSKDWTKV